MTVVGCGVWHTYITVEYYSAIKRMKYIICSNIDGLGDYHTEWGKLVKDIIWYHLHTESKQNHTNELICKRETNSQT